MKTNKTFFTEGAISPEFIANSIASHSAKKNLGAHSIFLGQVRADEIDGKKITGIVYSRYEEMADTIILGIREATLNSVDINCLHVVHSSGLVKTGEICLFVFVSSKHRKNAVDACELVVERIKKEVPVFGKEIFEDETHQWKVNN